MSTDEHSSVSICVHLWLRMRMIVRCVAAGAVWIALSASATAAPPETLVVVHSWTGRTATAGREIADMVGAKMLRASDAYGPNVTPTIDELSTALAGGTVRRLYLGFPVWDEAPSKPAQHFVETAPLTGVTVVPFYTYLHYIDPA